MRLILITACVVSLISVGGCPSTGGERSAFQTLTEEFGTASSTTSGSSSNSGGSGGVSLSGKFRSEMTVRFVNHDIDLDVDTKIFAWVEPSSIISFEQQDALIDGGYVQIGRELKLGDAYTLVPGTFVLNGTGYAGATNIRVGPDSEFVTTIITPDVLLVADAPPYSCESIAFRFTSDGFLATTFTRTVEGEADAAVRTNRFGNAQTDGPLKTLAQMDVYQCSPLQPGLFFRSGGGVRQPNEYFEGESVTFDLFPVPIAVGDTEAAGIVTIGG